MNIRVEENTAGSIIVSFVIIGYNEAVCLRACLKSVQGAQKNSPFCSEIIYVDGGSTDASISIAREMGIDRILGGDRRRRAAENRNLGLAESKGAYVQFVDGDMVLAPDWPEVAVAFLVAHSEVAAVCGNIEESGSAAINKALEIDWMPREGAIRHCGGAAMYRREVLQTLKGFPEDVQYGEEPLLCWRIRNQLHMSVYQLARRMVYHELGFRGLGDYWRRSVRAGATYAEVASKCIHSEDRLWFREVIGNFTWGLFWAGIVFSLIAGPLLVRIASLVAAGAILLRKSLQYVLRGYPFRVAVAYAVHTYFVKIPLSYGQLNWLARQALKSKARKASS
jgi:glycosyltransferase involved in cell wall biosynthesis